MACVRGAASPNSHTKLQLFSDAAGRCQNPACTLPLFRDVGGKRFHVGEMAHVFAANDDGPRARPTMSAAQRGSYDNLILLCPTCHTTIDKAPVQYPDSLILEWKRHHVERIDAAFGAVKYEDRAGARAALEPLMEENRIVFEKYGPDNEYRFDPESEMAGTWKAKMLGTIVPNNRMIFKIMDKNRAKMTSTEKEVLARFKVHVADLEARHVVGNPSADAERYPSGMAEMFVEREA